MLTKAAIQIGLQPSLPHIVHQFPKMVLPGVSIYLHKPNMEVEWVTAVARNDKVCLGLIVAFLNRHHGLAKIVSWYVIPECGGRGVGQQLLAGLEDWCRSQKIGIMMLELRDASAAYPVATHIFRKQGWKEQQPLVHRFKVAAKTVQNLGWGRYRRKPSGFKVIPWQSVSSVQYAELRERWRHDEQFQREFLSFNGENGIESSVSLGLCQADKVVGWVIAHRIRPDLIEYSTLFVEPGCRASGATVLLLGESFLRLAGTQVVNVIFQVKVENDLMLRFVRKRFHPILSEATLYRTEKLLDRGSTG
ncbi:MAG: GNAT family N-acetyltransferase [Candidatus Thiodiazotropha sp.]